MKEGRTRKEWIKNVAIIFLIVLLILTFFSNTIMNYSLPEVAAQYCMSGSITNKVKGTGTVQASDPYSVIYDSTRKVESVVVRSGDTVKKGDVLYILEDSESEELLAAQQKLEEMITAYERDKITNRVDSSVSKEVESGKAPGFDKQQSEIDSLKSKISSYDKKIANYEEEIALIAKLINQWKTDETLDINKKIAEATKELEVWELQVSYCEDWLEEAEGADEITAANNALKTSKSKVKEYKRLIAEYQATIDSEIAKLQKQIDEKNEAKDAIEATSTEVQTKLTNLISKYSTQYGLLDKLASIEDQKVVVEKLRGENGGSEIIAPTSGTILSVNFVAGQTIPAGSEIASIQVSGKGYTLSMTIDKEQASLISVGDEAEVTNSWWYSDIHARIISIRPDTYNPSKQMTVIFELEGDVSNGQSLTLTVGKRTSNYDIIIPTSAIREDANGKFIYRVKSKDTPLGTRYYAERINIKVLAEDGTQCAISGDMESWEYIITTASAPIEDGQLIRLKEY